MNITSSQQNAINKFLRIEDIPDLYKRYKWKKDFWDKDIGFPELYQLEKEIVKAARENSLCQDHLLKIATWGGLRNKNRISWAEPSKIKFYINDAPAEWLKKDPENAISILDNQIDGFGPTYCSKLLHFAVPQMFGALDTRLVRTFGENAKKYHFLELKAVRSGNGWMIPTYQRGWPREFNSWIAVLNRLAKALNMKGIKCPHPRQYEESGLRAEGIWLPADVETALFSYTYYEIDGNPEK